ncbi:putative protein kinase RLK-Pelle-WAK family [Helianthus debilis subsp. tardiflorus]
MFVATGNEYEPSVQWSQLCRHFEFHEILTTTKNFDESLVIGRGGFGKVYKGNIKNGSTLVAAAIKRLDSMSNQGASEFWAEVEMLSKLGHCHLVSLIGYCNHETEMILVYEYMPRGTLADHLHKLGTHLSWCQRLKICIGAARGLDYLHTGTGIEFGIIHRDVKSSNILLDESWAAKVSDFGLSKVLCPKRAVDNSLDCGIATWGQDSIKAGRLKGIVDSDIRREISTKCLKQFAKIAERCLDNYPKNRPTMAEVVLSLEYVLTLQEKTYNLSQTASKMIFGRMVDKFSFSDSGQNSGMDIGSFMPKKPYMNLGSLTPKRWKQLTPREKIFQKNGALLLEDKLKSGVGSIKLFQAEELEKATMNFAESMIIERGGGTGIVYKGILSDNRVVAIKRSRTLDEEQVEPFMNEILILGQINHRNVVQLLGCCLETEVPLLVCEFVSSYNLYHHIHHNTSSTGRFPLDSRLRITHESAGALAYLHSDATTTIIHRDVKSANILLDENYTAKVADFGASKSLPLGHDQVFTVVYGTLGYMDPEYMITGQLTDKSDVYSFGVVLAELLTGLKPIDEEDTNLATVFVQAKRENRLREIVDRQVLEEVTNEQLDAACNLVCRCLDREGRNRPSMKEVTIELERLRRLKLFNV